MSRASRSTVVDVDVFVHHATPFALLVSEDEDEDLAVWLLLSQIEAESTDANEITTVTIPEWLAIEKELI